MRRGRGTGGGESSYLAYPKSILTKKGEGYYGSKQNNLRFFVPTL